MQVITALIDAIMHRWATNCRFISATSCGQTRVAVGRSVELVLKICRRLIAASCSALRENVAPSEVQPQPRSSYGDIAAPRLASSSGYIDAAQKSGRPRALGHDAGPPIKLH